MSESKVFMFPDSFGGTPRTSGIDPNLMLALNNGGGFGGNGNWMWIFFLWFLWPLMRGNGAWSNGNGNGFGGLANMLNNDSGRELLMQAINNNGNAISNLANMFGCKTDTIISAINAVQSQIQNVGAQVGMTGQQIINAVQSGDCQLGQQIAACCCENRLAICQQTNTLQQAINNVAVGQERGFSNIGFQVQTQTCDITNAVRDSTQALKDNANANFHAIESRLDTMERNALQAKIDSLQETKSTLVTQLNLEHQNAVTAQTVNQAVAPIAAGVAGLQKEVDALKCKAPETVTIPYSPVVGVPTCAASQFGLGYGFGWGCGNSSLWG